MGSMRINNIAGANETLSKSGSQMTININPIYRSYSKNDMALNNGFTVCCHTNVKSKMYLTINIGIPREL